MMKISMIGGGSHFTDAILASMFPDALFDDCRLVLYDVDEGKLAHSMKRVASLLEENKSTIRVEESMDLEETLEGCRYVIVSCEKLRVPYWYKDIEIPQRHGVMQFTGENGGPGGQAHAMRNITLFMELFGKIMEICPDAWVMNFTNPMSFLCTYLRDLPGLKWAGICHQVKGSMGVISEMLGMEPGDLEFVSGGINHFNWLLEVRKRGESTSYLPEFLEKVRKSPYWEKLHPKIATQVFTRDLLDFTGCYPIGFDDHICEYVPFFYPEETWREKGYDPKIDRLGRDLQILEENKHLDAEGRAELKTKARQEFMDWPFPKDDTVPFYKESPVEIMRALETGEPFHLHSVVTPNRGCIDNLPYAAVVDVPATVYGGEIRAMHIGPLPDFPAELCRRQIVIHERIVKATRAGDRQAVYECMALDPLVHDLKLARKIADDFFDYYHKELPQFQA
jgi:alpha-galactosidase